MTAYSEWERERKAWESFSICLRSISFDRHMEVASLHQETNGKRVFQFSVWHTSKSSSTQSTLRVHCTRKKVFHNTCVSNIKCRKCIKTNCRRRKRERESTRGGSGVQVMATKCGRKSFSVMSENEPQASFDSPKKFVNCLTCEEPRLKRNRQSQVQSALRTKRLQLRSLIVGLTTSWASETHSSIMFCSGLFEQLKPSVGKNLSCVPIDNSKTKEATECRERIAGVKAVSETLTLKFSLTVNSSFAFYGSGDIENVLF